MRMDAFRSLGRGSRVLLALAVGGAVFGIATAVQADIPDGGVIHACYSKTTLALHVIDSDLGQHCNAATEKALDWNARGVTGPTGPVAVTMVLGSSTTVPAGGIDGETATCPSGFVAISGAPLIDPNVHLADLTLVTLDSYNDGMFSGNPPDDTWVVEMKNESEVDQSFQVEATCVPASSLSAALLASKLAASAPVKPRH
jgi:hypothetical protein